MGNRNRTGSYRLVRLPLLLVVALLFSALCLRAQQQSEGPSQNAPAPITRTAPVTRTTPNRTPFSYLVDFVDRLLLKVQRPSPPPEQTLKGVVIIVDPGHGGSDPGAIREGIKEADVTLSIANQLKKNLEARGAKVIMTRTSDIDVELEERRAITEATNADLFISVHINSMPYSNKANGVETYYRLAVSRMYAHTLHGTMIKKLGVPDRRVRRANFYVINCDIPAVLAEVGYITNQEERGRLISPVYQKAVADALADGIVAYWKKKHPGR